MDKEYVHKINEICLKSILFDDDLLELSRVNSNEVPEWLFYFAHDVLYDILWKSGKEWSDYDPEYPNNPYLFGYELNGHIFVTGYSGVVGNYWNAEGNGCYVCKP